MNINLEQTILRNMIRDEDFMRKVLPFIKPDYFEGIYRQLFRELGKFVGKYNKLPNSEAFKIELDQSDKFTDEQYQHAIEILPNLFNDEKVSNGFVLWKRSWLMCMGQSPLFETASFPPASLPRQSISSGPHTTWWPQTRCESRCPVLT